jgi:hypothetical protein
MKESLALFWMTFGIKKTFPRKISLKIYWKFDDKTETLNRIFPINHSAISKPSPNPKQIPSNSIYSSKSKSKNKKVFYNYLIKSLSFSSNFDVKSASPKIKLGFF